MLCGNNTILKCIVSRHVLFKFNLLFTFTEKSSSSWMPNFYRDRRLSDVLGNSRGFNGRGDVWSWSVRGQWRPCRKWPSRVVLLASGPFRTRDALVGLKYFSLNIIKLKKKTCRIILNVNTESPFWKCLGFWFAWFLLKMNAQTKLTIKLNYLSASWCKGHMLVGKFRSTIGYAGHSIRREDKLSNIKYLTVFRFFGRI